MALLSLGTLQDYLALLVIDRADRTPLASRALAKLHICGGFKQVGDVRCLMVADWEAVIFRFAKTM